MSDHSVVRVAEFDRDAVKKYLLVQPLIPLICTVVLIPIVPFIILGIMMFVDKYLDRLSCTLTQHSLELKKGIFNRVESTVPLGKITDLHMYQGPVMRYFGIHGLRVETAGQTVGVGALLTILGVVDTPGFRKAVFDQRDKLEQRNEDKQSVTQAEDNSDDLLVEIRDALLRIEQRLNADQNP